MSATLTFIKYLTLIRNSFFLLVLVLFATAMKIMSKQIRYPSLIFFSLSYEQAFTKSCPQDLGLFISEKRFKKYLDTSNVLWQVRSWKAKRVISRGFTYDSSFYLFTRCNSWRSIFFTAKSKIDRKKLLAILNQRYIKEVYTKGFENFTWSVTCQELKNRIQLVTTQSNYTSLPIGFEEKFAHKTFRVMMWYSLNSQGISRDFSAPEGISLDAIKGKIDQQLVWTENQRQLIKNKEVGQIAVVGSCLFQANPQIIVKKRDANQLSVLFFDVAPLKDNLSDKFPHNSDIKESLYDYDFCSRLLLDSISVLNHFVESRGISMQLKLKPKRRSHPRDINYNRRYIKLLEDLKIQDHRFSILSPDVNLYSIIQTADLVLGPPYTSPIFVARELGIPSCYVAFKAKGWRIRESLDSIPVHFSVETFQIFLEQNFLHK